MITPSDSEYKATKRVKQGNKTLKAPFDELAHWVASMWKVTVLNVIYDSRNSLHAPRLQVILEHWSDAAKFRNGVNFDQEKQIAIKTKFIEMISRQNTHKFDLDGLFVVSSAFAPLALQEADDQIPDKEVKALKARIGNPDLWEISRCFGSVTFFFYTDAQAKLHEADGRRSQYAKLYFDLLKPHDEFGYLDREEYAVTFDSKQNFDENYQSSWLNYYR